MPDKTNSELIRELSGVVTLQGARVKDLLRRERHRETALAKLAESLSALTTRVALLEHQVADLRKTSEEGGRRFWALVPPFLAAVIGGLLTFLGQLLLSYLRK